MTVSNGLSLVTLKSKEFTLCSGSFEWEGGGSIISFTQVKLTFPYIFLLVDCFEWALTGHTEKRRVHSVLWQSRMGGRESIVSFTWVKLTFPYIFLLVDCFKWALIGHIEKRRVHSVLWQFWMGGRGFIISFTRVNLKIWAPRCLGVLIKHKTNNHGNQKRLLESTTSWAPIENFHSSDIINKLPLNINIMKVFDQNYSVPCLKWWHILCGIKFGS